MPATTAATPDRPAVSHHKKLRRLGAPAGEFWLVSVSIAVHPVECFQVRVSVPSWPGRGLFGVRRSPPLWMFFAPCTWAPPDMHSRRRTKENHPKRRGPPHSKVRPPVTRSGTHAPPRRKEGIHVGDVVLWSAAVSAALDVFVALHLGSPRHSLTKKDKRKPSKAAGTAALQRASATRSGAHAPPRSKEGDHIGDVVLAQFIAVAYRRVLVVRHFEVRPPGDDDAAQGTIADKGQERLIVESIDHLAVLLDAFAVLAVAHRAG